MAFHRSVPVLLLGAALIACGDRADTGAVEEAPAMATGVGSGPVPPAASPGPIAEQPAAQPYPGVPGAAPAGAPATAAAPAAAVVLASQETNWPGIVAEVTEFRRRGNTLTAKVRLRNTAGADAQPSVKFDEVYLMDAPNARKYEVLRDEKGTYIASLRSGWADRWYETIEPTQQQTIWIKFPAPPTDVRMITLQLPNTPPFEDLAIQDG